MSNVDPLTRLQPAQTFSLTSGAKTTVSLGSGVTFWEVEVAATSAGVLHYLSSDVATDVDTAANTHRVEAGKASGWTPGNDHTLQLKAVGGAVSGRVRTIKVV